jgi:hypothetical protein
MIIEIRNYIYIYIYESLLFQLKYVEGAVPGKSLKRRTILSEDEQNQKKKKYEENRPDRKFNKNWKEGRQWLTTESLNTL